MNDIAVLIYLYHTDLWPEYRNFILPIKNDIKLYLGLCNKAHKDLIEDIKKINVNYQISIHDNYGADVAPFLYQIKHLVKEKYFIKIHSKKTKWHIDKYREWRKYFNKCLLSRNNFYYNTKIITKNEIGMISHKAYLLKNISSIHNDKIKNICNIIKLNYKNFHDSYYFAGNMFMSKTKLFQTYFNDNYEEINHLLSQEKGKVNQNVPTNTHALEKIFGYIIKHNQLKIAVHYNDKL